MTRDVLHQRLARLLTAEAALACQSLAGALVVAAAACIAGNDLAAVLRLPDARGRKRRIVVQRGQVDLVGGASLLQLLHLAGAEPIEAGSAAACAPEELQALLAADAAAGLFLYDDASRASGLLDLPNFVWACRSAGVPALVVCTGRASPLAALDAGAELVLVDPATLYGAEPAGLILGTAARLHGCGLQERGLGALFRLSEARLAAIVTAAERQAADLPAGLAVADHRG